MIIGIYIGEDKLDLFGNENIEVVSSIANTEDITKNTTDYTKSFTVPASHINNAIFKHYYNADIDNTFDARVKVDGRIELGGLPFKYGKFRLEKVNVKSGNPSSYTINFWGRLVSIKDKLKDDELSSLDFSAFNHDYTSANVKTGLTTSLFSGNIVYNLLAKKQYYYNSNSSDNVNTPTLANIAYNGGGINGIVWNDLKPSLRMIQIIEAIEEKYNIVFTRDFFGRSEFENLFMWLNNNATTQGSPTEKLIDWDSGNGSDFGLSLATDKWNNDTRYINASNFDYFQYRLTVIPAPAYDDIPYTIVVKNFGVDVLEIECPGGYIRTGFFDILAQSSTYVNFEYTFYIRSSESIEYECEILLRNQKKTGGIPSHDDRQSFASADLLTTVFDVSANMPKMKIIDFLRGLFNMFKLVVIADNFDNIYVNSLNYYYAEGKLYDITRFIDFNTEEVARGKILNEINFKFQEPTTILNKQFLENTGTAYGDELLQLSDENGELLDGDKLDYNVPFEQIVYERLIDINDNVTTNAMYGLVTDENIAPVNPKPHIFYNILLPVGTKTLAFINQSGTEEVLGNRINIPCHTIDFVDRPFSTVFGKEFNEWDGLIINNTLYSNYHQDYILSIFNIKRRNFKFKAILPLYILTKIQLNDVLKIRQNYYRIDNYTTNILNGESTLNLINSFDNVLNSIIAIPSSIFVDYREQGRTVYIQNAENISVDMGSVDFAVAFIDSKTGAKNALIYFFENNTGEARDGTITITETNTGTELTIYINQGASVVSADNITITADSTIITADNG